MAFPEYDRHVLIGYLDPDLEEIGFDRKAPAYVHMGTSEFGTRDLARALFSATSRDPMTIPLTIGPWEEPIELRIVVLRVEAWYKPSGPRTKPRGRPRPRDWDRSWCVTGYVLDPPEWEGFADGTHVRMDLDRRTIPTPGDVWDDYLLSPPTFQFFNPTS